VTVISILSRQNLALQTIKDYSVIVSAIFTAALVIAILTQTSILKADFDASTRPWIGVAKFDDEENNRINFIYHNFGSIPNDIGKMAVSTSCTMITLTELKDLPNDTVGSLMPTQSKIHQVGVYPKDFVNKSDNCKTLYIGVLIQYEYLNDKEGESGIIMSYADGNFNIEDNWSK